MTDTDSANWYSAEAATFGDRVAGAREAAGLRQEELARRIGVKLSTIQNWENDHSEPRANKLQMMSGMLNVSMRWLLTGEGEGVEAPVPVSNTDLNTALAELSRMRAQALALSQDMGHLEKRLRAMLRESAQ
ncbi:helix-turn-helix transcriptional regulator (plasmid) [Pseudorhodobacter turbinis]|uniref:Helix-turn-helix transcriptional regulator n=1 Tax=Pseudorhodobacter turbinis TaxID=2500533 RepID=A0A4P8ELE3_9RHOB|nr:helix-turn-helix transcriptional regulator [Pseudorhodobacter turbinis]QCO57886.1 helix-turn-helix transcriptional regulator [Pseudorhodobacter turbinis]